MTFSIVARDPQTGQLGAAVQSCVVAAAEVRSLVADRPSWAIVVRSFVDKGLVALPDGVSIDDVLA